jgi:hypothetical protein
MQISNGAKLNMVDGAYKDFRGCYPRHPRGIHRTWLWPCPTWRCPTTSLEQLVATHNDLMRTLVENDERRGVERQQPRHQERDSSYSDFMVTHPPVFADATDPLEADSWLHTTLSKFGQLHCTEYQMTLYTVQQLRHSWSMVGFLHRHPT